MLETNKKGPTTIDLVAREIERLRNRSLQTIGLMVIGSISALLANSPQIVELNYQVLNKIYSIFSIDSLEELKIVLEVNQRLLPLFLVILGLSVRTQRKRANRWEEVLNQQLNPSTTAESN